MSLMTMQDWVAGVLNCLAANGAVIPDGAVLSSGSSAGGESVGRSRTVQLAVRYVVNFRRNAIVIRNFQNYLEIRRQSAIGVL